MAKYFLYFNERQGRSLPPDASFLLQRASKSTRNRPKLLMQGSARGMEEASSSEVHPGVVADEESRPEAPEARTSEARTDLQEAAPCDASQSGALDASLLGASSSMPRAGTHVESLGRFHIDFNALRKRKEASGGNDCPCRPLKHMKYFAMDE